jgi:hypothetical protein
MGFVKANNKVDEAYYIYINNAAFTYVGVRYLGQPENKLGDLLAILVSEQTRFDTLSIYNKTFDNPTGPNAFNLYNTLYRNFREQVYNKWTENWG